MDLDGTSLDSLHAGQLTSLPPPAAPSAGLEHDYPCPLCLYNLRGCVEPRCPECGAKFSWEELLDPARQVHPFIFEHHPERNWWSYWKTSFAAWRPKRFWSDLRPTQRLSVRRLLLYWLLGAALPFVLNLLFASGYILSLVHTYEQGRAQHVQRITTARMRGNSMHSGPPNLSPQQIVDSTYPPLSITSLLAEIGHEHMARSEAMRMIAYAPIVATLAFMVFRFSLRRARLRPDHLFRCAVYCFDQSYWLGPMLAIAMALPKSVAIPIWAHTGMNAGTLFSLIAFGCAALQGGWRLAVACEKYLHFSHPRGVAAAVLAMQALVLVNLLFAPNYFN